MVEVEPSDPDPDNVPNGASHGANEPAHANGPPGEGDRWLRSVVQNSSEIVTIVDPDGTLRYASPAFERVLGYDREEAVGTMNVLDHVHLDDLPHVLEETEKALSEGGITCNKAEYRFRHRDGSWRWIESVGTYLLDDPAVGGVVVALRDVTERKEAEEALRRSEAEIFDVLESITDAFFALDREWRFTYVNSQAGVLFSRTREDLIGERIWEDPTFYPQYRKAVAEGITARFEAYYPSLGAWYSVRAYPSESGLSVYLQDVTERKEFEARIRFQSELLDAVGNAVIATDPDGKVLYWNRAAEDLYGWSAKEVMGRSVGEFGVPEDLRGRLAEIMEELRAGRSWSGEFTVLRKDGGSVPVLVTDAPVHDERGNLIGIIGVSTDVSERREAEAALRESERRFRALTQNSSDVVTLLSATGTILYQTPSIERVLGYGPEETLGDNAFGYVHPDDLGRVETAFAEGLKDPGRRPSVEHRFRHKDGSWRWLESVGTNLLGKPGVGGYVINSRDVTERRRAEEERAQQAALLEQTHDAVFRREVGGKIVYWNEGAQRLYGWSKEDALGRACHDLLGTVHPVPLEEIVRTLRSAGHWEGELVHHTRDGRRVVVESRQALARDDGASEFVLETNRDVTERKALEGRLEHQAFHDSLTTLPNRHLLLDRLGRALGRTRRTRGRKAAVLFMDLDGFKVINDSLGHEVGDLLLTVVAQRLRRCLRSEDTLARFGGDEFVVLLEDVEGPDEAVRVAGRVTDELRRPFGVDGRQLFIAASIGIALGNARTKTPESLLRDADTAMYRAKDEHADYRVFDPAMYERALDRLELESDLRRAIERDEFVVHYQPVVDLKTGEAWGMEALVRWEHPDRGLLNPSEFMPVVEESGMIVPVGEGVLEKGCRQAQLWHQDRGTSPLVVSLNLSAVQLRRSDLARTVAQTLRKTGLDARRLSLDVTETAYIRVLEEKTTALDRLKKLGVGIAIDDFGVGYSSLSYLKRLPADVVKIDRSFVKGLGEDVEDTAIVRMVIDLAHTLGMKVVAEGVEGRAQAALLRDMGCDLGQGYHYSRPLPPEEVPEFLTR